MIGENRPFAYGWYYETPVPVYKVGPRIWRFQESWTWGGVTIPKGYEVDGASVPRWFWHILSPSTEGFRAACVHDFRHTQHGRKMTQKERKFADDEFFRNLLRCMTYQGEGGRFKQGLYHSWNYSRASLSWFGVRAWALTAWRFTDA